MASGGFELRSVQCRTRTSCFDGTARGASPRAVGPSKGFSRNWSVRIGDPSAVEDEYHGSARLASRPLAPRPGRKYNESDGRRALSDGDDKPSWTERDKLSFSELDRRRRERRQGHEPRARSEKGRQREAAATHQYLKQIDGLFGKEPQSAEVEGLARAMRDAHGTPGLAAACRAYRDAAGIPDDLRDVGLFLDCREAELVVAALEALRGRHEAGGLDASSGLRSQLRSLAQDRDDAVAEAAEELLAALG